MSHSILFCCAIGWSFFCGAVWSMDARADDAFDAWLGQRLARRVNIDVERGDHISMLRDLSKATGVPIDVDKHSLQLLGITRCQSSTLQLGEKPAIEILEWIASEIDREDRVTFVVTEDEEKRTPAGMRVLIVGREWLPKHAAVLPPNDPKAAAQVMEERLSKTVDLPAREDTLAAHLARLGEAIGLPIELDSPSIDNGLTPNPSLLLPEGEQSAGMLLVSLLKTAGPDKPLRCYLADDAQRRMPHEVRIVVAAPSVLESNPARFTSPPCRPTATMSTEMAERLQQSISLNVTDTPLRTAIGSQAVREMVKIDWDFDAMWRGEMDRERRVTIDVTNQPLGTVLRKMLADAGTPEHPLVFTVWNAPGDGEKLVITSRTAVRRKNWRLPECCAETTK